MGDVLSTELKSDLERIYKINGDLLNTLENKDLKEAGREVQELISTIRFGLHDIEGTLQKDIYNCDFLITKFKTDGNET